MVRTLSRLALLAVGMAAVGGIALADDKDEPKIPDNIKDIMKKGHGSKGLLKGIKANVKEGKWEDVMTDAKLLKAFGGGLGKLKPPMGDDASWKKMTEKYKDTTVKVFKAAEKKDGKGVDDGIGVIQKSCKSCHDAHKGS